MIRRFLAFLCRPRVMPAPAIPTCRVQTDLNDLELHTGDWIVVERATGRGFVVLAVVLRAGQLEQWPLYHTHTLAYAERLRGELDDALTEGAHSFRPLLPVRQEMSI